MRSSSSRASCCRWASWPSSQAIRNWRPLMVTVTWGKWSSLAFEHVPNIFHRGIQPPRHLAVGGLEAAHLGDLSVEISRETGAVGIECMHLFGQDRPGPIGFDSALDRGVETIQRRGEAAGGLLDSRGFRHDSTFTARQGYARAQ